MRDDVYGGTDEWGDFDRRLDRDSERERLPVRAAPPVRESVPRCRYCGGVIEATYFADGRIYGEHEHAECVPSASDVRDEQLELQLGGGW